MFKISEVHVHIYVKKGSHPPTIPFGLPSIYAFLLSINAHFPSPKPSLGLDVCLSRGRAK